MSNSGQSMGTSWSMLTTAILSTVSTHTASQRLLCKCSQGSILAIKMSRNVSLGALGREMSLSQETWKESHLASNSEHSERHSLWRCCSILTIHLRRKSAPRSVIKGNGKSGHLMITLSYCIHQALASASTDTKH